MFRGLRPVFHGTFRGTVDGARGGPSLAPAAGGSLNAAAGGTAQVCAPAP
ncbi:hypothetical protein L6V77_32360 [Myxococcota bacterium]|nr:hypothetical protein [Myxococcota bacterium]